MNLADLCDVPSTCILQIRHHGFFPLLTKPCAGYLADEEGIANAQKSLGLGNDDGSRRMR